MKKNLLNTSNKQKCSCGRELPLHAAVKDGYVACPGCGLMHQIKACAYQKDGACGNSDSISVNKFRQPRNPRSGLGWVFILVAGCSVLLLLVTMSWAILGELTTRSLDTTNPSIADNVNVAKNDTPADMTQTRSDGDWYSDNVGILIVVMKFAGSGKAAGKTLELLVGNGSCFGVTKSGVLLTNKHVIAESRKKLKSKHRVKGQIWSLQEISVIACFGKSKAQHYKCKILHESQKYDLAVLKIDRTFSNPVKIKNGPLQRGDDILLVGYPGVVQSALLSFESESGKNRVDKKLRNGDAISYFDQIASSAYEPTLTNGIVSAVRTMKGIQTLQVSATAAGGNSGGPLLCDKTREAVGILTYATSSGHTSGGQYSFAPEIGQMMGEIRPHLGGAR